MTRTPKCLIDDGHSKLASLDVQFMNDHFEGSVALGDMPPTLLALFIRYEEIVEGQMFSMLDGIEEEIESLSCRVRFDDGTDASVADLQIFPSTNSISFKLLQPAAVR